REDRGDVGIAAVGDERLAAVQYVPVALFHGGGFGGARVGAGTRFGQSPCAQPLSAGQQRNVSLLLGFIAGKKNVVRTQRIVGRHNDADGAVHGRELFNRQHV